jgi:hypothetical protein
MESGAQGPTPCEHPTSIPVHRKFSSHGKQKLDAPPCMGMVPSIWDTWGVLIIVPTQLSANSRGNLQSPASPCRGEVGSVYSTPQFLGELASICLPLSIDNIIQPPRGQQEQRWWFDLIGNLLLQLLSHLSTEQIGKTPDPASPREEKCRTEHLTIHLFWGLPKDLPQSDLPWG